MELRFPLILDGATGTELQKRGYTGDVSAEQWTLSHPEAIRAIQRDYVAAGSQVLYTPTFGGNAVKLAEHGVTADVADCNRRLAALSREAAAGKALLAGDLAPTGLFLSPLGNAAFEDLVDAYARQVAGLEEAGVDLYVIETMMTLSDARAAVLAVRAVTDKPIFVTFTCDQNGRSISGTDVTAALTVLQGMGIDAFGLNCSAGPEQMLPQLRRLREYARVPLIAKPNAGMPIIENGETVYRCTGEEFTALVPEFLAAGVAVFGWKFFRRAGRQAGYRFNEALAAEKRRARRRKTADDAKSVTLTVPGDYYALLKIAPGSPAVGETIKSLDIRAKTGASVVAVRRGADLFRNPGASWCFEPDDEARVIGDPDQLAALRRMFDVPQPDGTKG